MNIFKENLRDLKHYFKADTNKELAEKLKITESAIDGWKRRETIPAKYMIMFDENKRKNETINFIEKSYELMKYVDPEFTYKVYRMLQSQYKYERGIEE